MTAAEQGGSAPAALPPGAVLATYGAAFFSIGLQPIIAVVIPLWSLELGATPALVGAAIGIRSLLPFLLSIHVGALMDRLGVRRVVVCAAAVAVMLPPLYPLLPSIEAVIALQLLDGLAQAIAWIGAQTQIAKISRGNPNQASRFAFWASAGTFLGPLAAGWSWDRFGATATFGLVTLWMAALLLCALRLPHAPPVKIGMNSAPGWRGLMPRPSDYRTALALIAIPAIAVVIGGTVLRMSALSIQQSIYPVYLESIGFTGTTIGALIGIGWAVAAASVFLAAPTTRRASPAMVFVLSIGVAIAAISMTPLFTAPLPLVVAVAIFGAAIGLSEPLVVTLIARGAEGGRHGMSFGLRATANRAASLSVPVAMGVIADLAGLVASFAVLGGALLLLCGGLALAVRRIPAGGGPQS